MIVRTNTTQAHAIARAIASVVDPEGTGSVSAVDAAMLRSALTTVFGRPEHEAAAIDLRTLPPIAPVELAAILDADVVRLDCVRVLSVAALVDVDPQRFGRPPRPGRSVADLLDGAKLARVVAYAGALGVGSDFVHAVTDLAARNIPAAVAAMARNAAAAAHVTTPHPWVDGHDDTARTRRYSALVALPAGTLGRAFIEHYRRNGYPLPGEPTALAEEWATPHDCLHILSGYSTSPQGELLVAAFTGGMLGTEDFFASHVLPAILAFHLGIGADGRPHPALDPAKLWVAWERGGAMSRNLYDTQDPWDFWAHAEHGVAELRADYDIPHLDPHLAALPDDAIDPTVFRR